MSSWSKFGLSTGGEEQNGSETKNAVDVDWFSNDHDIFSGGTDTLLVDPRELKRAETAPSVLTMFSADGTLCVGGSLEEEVPPEEEYRYTEEYHMLYYSKFPRDPRMLVPLRTRGSAKRGGEMGLPGRGITGGQKPQEESGGATTTTPTDTATKDKNIGRTATANPNINTTGTTHIASHEMDENAHDAKEKGAAFAKSVLESLSREENQIKQHSKKQEEAYQSASSTMGTHQVSTSVPVESNSTGTTMEGGYLPPIDNMVCNNALLMQQPQLHNQQNQDSAVPQSVRHVGGLAPRRGARGGNRGVQSGPMRSNSRRQINTGDMGVGKPSRDEFAMMREYLDGAQTESLLEEVKGHVVAMSKDQDGSRLIQRLLDDEQNVEPIFNEVFESTHEVITDVFGNYVLQKLLDVLPAGSSSLTQLILKVNKGLKEYSFQMYGCRVIQKILDKASPEIREEMLLELKESLLECIFDQNANHVAQKIIEVMPEKIQFLVEELMLRLKTLSRHPYGCRVLQCIFEKSSQVSEVNIRPLLEAVLDHLHEYVMDQYGNYVVQHAMLNAPEDLRQRFVELLIPHVYALSCSKFASNVAEKTIVKANEEELQRIVETLTHPLGGSEDGNYLVLMMQDPYANYVVQRLFQEVNKAQQQHIAEQTSPHIISIRRSVYGQHLLQKMETMGMFSWMDGSAYNGTFYRDHKHHHHHNHHHNNNNNNSSINNNNIVVWTGGRRSRGGLGTRGGSSGGSSRSTPQNNHLTSVEHQLAANNPYHQATTAVAVSGQNVLPLATATGSGYGYGYLGSPSDSVLIQSQQPHLISAPSLAVGGQPCYPGIIPQQRQRQPFTLQGQHDPYTTLSTATAHPQQQQQHHHHHHHQQQHHHQHHHHHHHQQQTMTPVGDVYSAGAFYTNGKGIMTQGNEDAWAHSYQGYHPSMHPAMLCRGNTPNVYPTISATFQQAQYNHISTLSPITMQPQ